MTFADAMLAIGITVIAGWAGWLSLAVISIRNKLAYMDGSAPLVKLQLEALQLQINDMRERIKMMELT
jgi:hypothetical protein